MEGATVALLSAAGAVSAPAAAGEPPRSLAEAVSAEETVFYAAIEDVAAFRQGASETAIGKMWREEEIRVGLGELAKMLEEDQEGRDALAFLRALKSVVEGPWRRAEIACAIEEPKEGEPVLVARGLLSGPPVLPSGLTAEGLAALFPNLAGRLRLFKGGWRLSFEDGEVLLALCAEGCFFAAALGRGAVLSQGITWPVASSPPQPLAAALPPAGAERAAAGRLLAFFNGAAGRRAIARPAVAREMGWDAEALALARLMGLDRVDQAFLTLRPDGEGFRQTAEIRLGPGNSGFWPAFAAAPQGALRSFARLPADALLAIAGKLSWETLRDGAAAGLDALPPLDAREVRGWTASLQAGAGVSIARDLLPALGEEAALAVGRLPPGLPSIPPLVVLIEVKDAAQVEACLARVADFVKERGAPYAKTPYAGTALYNFGGAGRGRGPEMFFQPTFAVTETHLAASTSPQALKGLLSAWKRPDFKGLAGEARFQAAAARVRPEWLSCGVVDLPQIVALAYNTVLQFAGIAQGFGGKPVINVNALPPSEVLTRHLSVAIAATRAAPDRLSLKAWSPLGTHILPVEPVTLSACGVMAVAGAAAERRRQRLWTCEMHLRRVYWSVTAVAQDGNPLPMRFEELLLVPSDDGHGSIPLEAFYCPLDPAAPPASLDATDAARAGEWIRTHPSSYRWIRRHAREGREGRVVAFERKPSHDGSRHVLFVGGGVELVDEERFQTLAREQNLLPRPRPAVALTPELERQIAARVAALGSDAFAAREEATKWLLATGPVTRPFLEKAAKSLDLETRSRAVRLLESFAEEEMAAE